MKPQPPRLKPRTPTQTLTPHSNSLTLVALLALLAATMVPSPALACGGFFCLNSPINQQVERIIFTQDGSTINAYVQINYTGSDESFAWVVPVPSVPEVDVAEMDMFLELDTMTTPTFIPPPIPECALRDMPIMAVAESAADGGVTVYSSGEVGPFGFDVVGSEDPDALIHWLQDNGYRIEETMYPLVHVYVQEQMLFLAMKLRPGQGVQDIQPVKMTYQSEWPMIPLRLTAVAANPNMGVLVWLFGNAQYESDNYQKLEIPDAEIQFDPFGGHNYFILRSQAIDEVGGQGFVTEYAGPTHELVAIDQDLQALLNQHPYMTRAYTEISPEEMTVDPTFRYNESLPPMSNIHDLSDRPSGFECADETVQVNVPAVVQRAAPEVVQEVAPRGVVSIPKSWLYVGGACLAAVAVVGALGVAFVAGRRRR